MQIPTPPRRDIVAAAHSLSGAPAPAHISTFLDHCRASVESRHDPCHETLYPPHRSSGNRSERLLAIITAALLVLLACVPLFAHAEGVSPEALPASTPLPLRISEPGDCSRILNPALLASEPDRRRLLSARAAAAERVRTALSSSNDGSTSASASGVTGDRPKVDRLSFVSGPPTLRKDAAGRYLIRVGFLVTDKAWTRYGEARIRSDAQAALVDVNQQFANSGIPLVFEYATAERYAGKLDEATMTLYDIYDTATAPADYYLGYVPGNYDALLDFRARNAANVAILMTIPVNSGPSGITDRGRRSFEALDFLVAIDSGRSESVTTVFANMLTHELGHMLGLRHGVSQDLAPAGLDSDPEQVVQYRLSTNYPYGAGAVVQDETGAGVASMMTSGWYKTPTKFPASSPTFVKQFSDPTVSVNVIGGDGKTKRFALGVPDQEDSVRALRQEVRNFAISSTPLLAAWKVSVVEYYHAGLNQYFMTANAEQIDLLDSLGTAKSGWARTGETMNAVSPWGDYWKISAPGDPNEPRPVLRFYGSPEGPNSHFYTAKVYHWCGRWAADGKTWLTDTCEEEILRRAEIANAGNPHTLHYEGVDFRTYVATHWTADHANDPLIDCNAAAIWFPTEKVPRPVFRLYNGENGTRSRADGSRIDANHRFTTSMTIADRMVAQGWIFEGTVWCERMFEGR